jgi:archaemetzincin
MDQPHLTLISFGYFEKDFLEKVAEAVMHEFNHTTRIREGHVDLSEFFDAGRRQYNANQLLQLVDYMSLPECLKTIGLFNVDLFIPILTYIFGQAALGGKSGIASLYRLNNEYYGMPADKTLLLERFKKEVIHELGHTFGLIHCNSPVCVMRSSTYVEDIDQKERHLCDRCRSQIKVI